MRKYASLICALLVSMQAYSNSNIIRVNAPIAAVEAGGRWVSFESLFSEWKDIGEPTGCSEWTPSADAFEVGKTFTQTAQNCTMLQQRYEQRQEKNIDTQEVRPIGDKIEATRVIVGEVSRNQVGIRSCHTFDWGGKRWRKYGGKSSVSDNGIEIYDIVDGKNVLIYTTKTSEVIPAVTEVVIGGLKYHRWYFYSETNAIYNYAVCTSPIN